MIGDHDIDFRFVHGVAGSAADFDPLRANLPPGWRGEAVDLPGHGLAAPPNDGDDVARISELMVTNMTPPHETTVLVGHSTGGVLLLDAVSRRLLSPAALVLIDSNVPVGQVARAAIRAKAARAALPDWWGFFVASVAESIGGQTQPETRSMIEACLRRVPRNTIHTIWRAVLSYDATAAWVSCPCPVLYVRTTRAISTRELETLRGRPAGLATPVQIVALPRGLGHYPHLTDPVGLAKTVEAFVRVRGLAMSPASHRSDVAVE